MTEQLTIKQAARLLGVHPVTLHRWIKKNKIAAGLEYEGNQPLRVIDRAEVARKLAEMGKTAPETAGGELAAPEAGGISISTLDANSKQFLETWREAIAGDLKIANRRNRVYTLGGIALIMIGALALTISIANKHLLMVQADNERLKGAMLMEIANGKEAQETTREALEAELAASREQITALETSARAGDEATLAEIRALRAIIEAQGERIATLAERLEREPEIPAPPSPGPEATPAERSRFLGIF